MASRNGKIVMPESPKQMVSVEHRQLTTRSPWVQFTFTRMISNYELQTRDHVDSPEPSCSFPRYESLKSIQIRRTFKTFDRVWHGRFLSGALGRALFAPFSKQRRSRGVPLRRNRHSSRPVRDFHRRRRCWEWTSPPAPPHWFNNVKGKMGWGGMMCVGVNQIPGTCRYR